MFYGLQRHGPPVASVPRMIVKSKELIRFDSVLQLDKLYRLNFFVSKEASSGLSARIRKFARYGSITF